MCFLPLRHSHRSCCVIYLAYSSFLWWIIKICLEAWSHLEEGSYWRVEQIKALRWNKQPCHQQTQAILQRRKRPFYRSNSAYSHTRETSSSSVNTASCLENSAVTIQRQNCHMKHGNVVYIVSIPAARLQDTATRDQSRKKKFFCLWSLPTVSFCSQER